jgi:hypothetical protein
MGFTRAQKEAYFNRLKELIVEFRTFVGFIVTPSQLLKLSPFSFNIRGQC